MYKCTKLVNCKFGVTSHYVYNAKVRQVNCMLSYFLIMHENMIISYAAIKQKNKGAIFRPGE